jgi:hypothetical protein
MKPRLYRWRRGKDLFSEFKPGNAVVVKIFLKNDKKQKVGASNWMATKQRICVVANTGGQPNSF